MIVRATAHPPCLNPMHPTPLLRPRAGLAPLVPPLPGADEATATRPAAFGDTAWAELDDAADADEPNHEADAADAALLRCVGCAAFATLVLALVSSLQMG